MLTPFFELTQTDDKLFISIHAPYSNISNAEIYVDKDDFRFYSSPYYLRLHLPGHVEDTDEPTVHYNADMGHFNVVLTKTVPGENFEDLDLIAKFLSPLKNRRVNIKPDIQVLSSSTNDNVDNSGDDDNNNEGNSDGSSDEWLIDQQVPSPILQSVSETVNFNKSKYGFANKMDNVFNIVKDEFREIFDIINVEETFSEDRKRLKETAENSDFSDDHYLFDLMEPSPLLLESLQFKTTYSDNVKLSGSESDLLKNFGNKEYLLSKDECKTAYFSLVDILFAYAYDQRTTLGESTVESAWTINKLSATLSWLQSFSNVKEVVISCMRRSLCYPLFRHWELSMGVLDDTINILKSGNRQVLRCLLGIHKLFNSSEPRYILNQLYITDYCIWLQSDNISNKLLKLSDQVYEVKETLTKSEVCLDIDILEIAAYSTLDDFITDDNSNSDVGESSSSSYESESDSEASSSSSSSTELDSDDVSSDKENEE
ncbi:protein SHQ1 homolog [Lycorma delicatula]|uniref:protein SHQ1 homolog n=1 Tax=Lycorma delicatula TaxID=130591 RepID=UPI003F519C8D